jgi:hypothetical protein
MATEFTVIFFQRQHFGDEPNFFNFLGPHVPPFVGLTKDFQFNCPDINPRETAVLMFQSLGVVAQTNVLQINGGASCSGSCYNSEGNPCGGCAPQQGLPDSIITCGCEVSACAQSGSGCKLDQTNFGGVWSRALVAAPAPETKQP